MRVRSVVARTGMSGMFLLTGGALLFSQAQSPVATQLHPSLKSLNVFVDQTGGAFRLCEIAGRFTDSSGRDWVAVKLRLTLAGNPGLIDRQIPLTIDEVSNGEGTFDSDIDGGCHGTGRIATAEASVSVVDAVPTTDAFSRLSLDGETFVASDQQCLSDYVTAVKAGGLEMRKRIAELIAYKCGYVVAAGTYVSTVSKSAGGVRVKIERGPNTGMTGWVLAFSVTSPK
jgi:hypothetical protein